MGSQEEKDKKDKQKGWVTTLSVHAVLLVLFAFFGMHYQDPPKEYAIVMEFGGAPESSQSPAKQEDEKEDKETDKSKDPGGKKGDDKGDDKKNTKEAKGTDEAREVLKSFASANYENNDYSIEPPSAIPLTSDKDGIGDIGKIGYGDGKALNSKGRLESLGNLETLGEEGWLELEFKYSTKEGFNDFKLIRSTFSGDKEKEAFKKAIKALKNTKIKLGSDDPDEVRGILRAAWKYKS